MHQITNALQTQQSIDAKFSGEATTKGLPKKEENNLKEERMKNDLEEGKIQEPYNETKHLKELTNLFYESVTTAVKNDLLKATPFNDGKNAVINIKEAKQAGFRFARPTYNRGHEKDKDKTGESICEYGPQQAIILCPISVMDFDGFPYEKFATEKDSNWDFDPTDFAVIDGNGRMDYFMEKPEDEWPDNIIGIFVSVGKDGYLHLKDGYEELNVHVEKWRTKDFASSVLIQNPDENLKNIQELEKKGYTWTAACEWIRFEKGELKKSEVLNLSKKNYFTLVTSASKIYKKAVETFGEGDDKIMKNKPVVECLIRKFELLKSEEYDKTNGEAVNVLVDFLECIKGNKATQIKKATKKDNQCRDSVRCDIIDEEWNKYLNNHGISKKVSDTVKKSA